MPAKLKHIIVIGPTTRRIMEPYLEPETVVHYVPNFTDVEKGPRVKAEKNKDYAFVGRYSPEKDPVSAAQAAYLAKVPIRFIGTGPLVDEIRIANPDADLRGWRTPSEVKRLLGEVRAIIFPSVWYEGQPLVIDEAAALGLPVIVSETSAATDSVEKFRHGLTFETGNVDALVRRIQEFEFDDVVESYSKAGYQSYWENPSMMSSHIKALMTVYDVVLSDAS